MSGLYSDLQFMYPLLGTSRFLVVGPVAIMSLLIRVALEREPVGLKRVAQRKTIIYLKMSPK